MRLRPPPSTPSPQAVTPPPPQPRDGDAERALDVTRIVEQQRARVRRVLRARGVAERDLADAEQDVFLVVHRKLAGFEGRSSVATWLHRIAVNVASEHRRKAYQRYESLAADVPEPSAADPLAQLETRAALQRVSAALEALSVEQREAFLLHEVVGLSMHEVAERLHVPLKTAFSRFYAARRGLTAALARRGIAPSALWAWLVLSLPSRLASRARALAPEFARTSFGAAQLPLVSVALICSLLPALAPKPVAVKPAPAAVLAEASGLAPTRARFERPARNVATERSAPHAFASAAPQARTRPATRAAHRSLIVASHNVAPARDADNDAPPRSAGAAPLDEGDADDDMIVTRTGAEDLRPQLEHPWAAYLAPQRSPGRIQVRGPRDAANAVEESLADSQLP